MARKMTEWPSKRGPITKIMPSDGCIGDTVPLAVGKWYDFHEFGWYMGNVGQEKFDSLRSGRLQDLDILITLRGSVGKFGLFKATEHITTGFINAQLLIIRCLELEIVLYIVTFMKSDDFAKQISLLSSGAATPQLSAGKLAEVLITLPPLAEQRRIVAKVDELMALCDRLEESIITGNDACRRLFDALLAEALAPAQAREIKAAE